MTDELRAEAILCRVTGTVRVSRLCPHCGSTSHGQPRLVGSRLSASISYAGGLVAVAWGASRVGVDMEPGAAASRHRGVPYLGPWTRVKP